MVNVTLNDRKWQKFLLGSNLSFEERFHFYTNQNGASKQKGESMVWMFALLKVKFKFKLCTTIYTETHKLQCW